MNFIKPEGLKIGDYIGVIAPSSYINGREWPLYNKGVLALKKMGFRVKEGCTVKKWRWQSVQNPIAQAKDINRMFSDRKVKAIFAATGGTLASDVLPYIDFNNIIANPKPFIGMSDITTFHLAFLSKCRLIGYHMDNLIYGFGCFSSLGDTKNENIEREIFFKTLVDGTISSITPSPKMEYWKNGKAEGKIIGGNLRMMNSLIGTDYFPPKALFKNSVLFWEDFNSPLHMTIRNLIQLKQCGLFNLIGGLIVGNYSTLSNDNNGNTVDSSLKNALLTMTKEYNFPILMMDNVGHYTLNYPMILGLRVVLDAKKKSFQYLEDAVRKPL